jgi:O-antigen/teichoic acid export membrane protein
VSVLRNTSITLAGRYAGNGAKALTALVVATTLGASGAGTFALVRIWPHMLAALVAGGISIAAPCLVASRRHGVQAITETVMALGLLRGVVIYAGWVVAAGMLEAKFHNQLSYDAVLLVGLAIPFLTLRNDPSGSSAG